MWYVLIKKTSKATLNSRLHEDVVYMSGLCVSVCMHVYVYVNIVVLVASTVLYCIGNEEKCNGRNITPSVG
jgi:hypothetical protein